MRLRALLRTQPRRALLQSAQALPRYRHTLRQTRQKFSCRCAASCDYNLAQLKTGPSPATRGSHGGSDMAKSQFENRRACEAVYKEMDRLILAGRPKSPEERQVRQLQFTALVERRDGAARNLLRVTTRRDS